MGSPFTQTSVSNYNSNPPSDDGAQTAANRVQWSTHKQKLTDPLKTAFDTSEAATGTAFGKVVGGSGITTTAVDYTVTASDQGKIVECTVSGKTITTPDATAVLSPFVFFVLNSSSGNITLDGNGSQTVDGVTSITIPAGAGAMLNTDGSNWKTGGKNFFQAGAGIAFDATTSPATINAPLAKYIAGLELSTAGSSSTMTIVAGAATDTTGAALMALAAAIGKTTSSWAVGTGNGGLDTGAVAINTWYHFFLIKRPDTGVVDVLFSLSATSPTMPTNYTLKRRIGSGKTDGSSQWTLFTQTGDKFEWSTQVLDVNAVTPTTGALNTVTLTVPTGVRVEALIHTHLGWVSGAASTLTVFAGGGILGATPSLANHVNANASNTAMSGYRITTSTSAQIATIMTFAGSTSYSLMTEGWIDLRGK